MLLAQLREQDQELEEAASAMQMELSTGRRPTGLTSAVTSASTTPDNGRSLHRVLGRAHPPRQAQPAEQHVALGVPIPAVDVVLHALVQNAPAHLVGRTLLAVVCTRFIAAAGDRNGWIRVAHRVVPAFNPQECALSFVLPVGFYESREMRVELLPLQSNVPAKGLSDTQSNGANSSAVVSARCGFAEMRLADEAILVHDEVNALDRHQQDDAHVVDMLPHSKNDVADVSKPPLLLRSARFCSVSFSVQDVVRAESCIRLNLTTRVIKRRAWPYEGGPSLFWVLFRQEDDGARWTVLYRSEVRSSRDIFGEFRFLTLAIDRYALNDYTPTRILRVEFFQFCTPPAVPVLLACSQFTERDLRTAEPGAELPFVANATAAAPDSALSGALAMKSSSHTNSRSPCYRLSARFLTATPTTTIVPEPTTQHHTIFLDISVGVQLCDWPYGAARIALSVHRVSKRAIPASKFVAALSSTHSSSEQQLEHRSSASSADGTATVIYKSETVRPHRADGFARFKVIKIMQADLGSARDPVLRIEWFQHLRAGQDCSPRSLGSIELSRDSILAVAPGSTLPFHPSSGLIATTSAAVRGTVRVQQAEDLSDRAFFALCAEFAVANSAGMPRSNTR